MGVWMYVRLSVCLFVCLSVCLSVYLVVCLSVYISVCLSVCLSVCMSVCLSVCLSVRLFVCACVLVCLCVCARLCHINIHVTDTVVIICRGCAEVTTCGHTLVPPSHLHVRTAVNLLSSSVFLSNQHTHSSFHMQFHTICANVIRYANLTL